MGVFFRACLLGLCLLAASAAEARELRKTLRFEPGTSSASVEGGVIRGDRDAYELRARAGQRMKVSVTSVESNAAIAVLAPGGKALPGADEGDDATAWEGELPATGPYRIVVGPTRGNTEYTLSVSIR